MELHNLRNNAGAKKKRKRVGRGPGSGHGKTSCRGQKGQKSRAGYSRRLSFEGGQMPLHRRLPKRGFNHADRWPMAVVNIDSLEKAFEAGAEVTSAAIVAAGLARATRGGIKVLGRGEVSKGFTIKVQAISPSAQKKIEAVGGTVEIVVLAPVASEKDTTENAE
ncbi:MAG: 50S ribosomal protein L15 [Candidatus Hydrogenedentes bacterium]|nr:50S ribosomal protein L15 [Candidatus Hydrogenedentota bacterium]